AAPWLDDIHDDLRVSIRQGICQGSTVGQQHWSIESGILRHRGERVAEQKTFNGTLGLFRDRVGEGERRSAPETDAVAIVFAENKYAHGVLKGLFLRRAI